MRGVGLERSPKSFEEETIPENRETIKSHSLSAFQLKRDEDDDDDEEMIRERRHGYINDELQSSQLLDPNALARWDFPIFNLSNAAPETLLSRV